MTGNSDIIQASDLRERSSGSKDIKIGIIDGPIMTGLPEFSSSRIVSLAAPAATCRVPDSLACRHGTFVTGMLAAPRDSFAAGICPECTFIIRPLFCESGGDQLCPTITSTDLAAAIRDVVQAGASLINLSVGMASGSMEPHPDLDRAIAEAEGAGVLVVAASGNQGRVGHLPLFRHPWTIPVAACDSRGQMNSGSNTGISAGKRGLRAPGTNIRGLGSDGQAVVLNGSSFAAPQVTGHLALLASLYPGAAAHELRRAVLMLDGQKFSRRSVIPPLLNVHATERILRNVPAPQFKSATIPGLQKATRANIKSGAMTHSQL